MHKIRVPDRIRQKIGRIGKAPGRSLSLRLDCASDERPKMKRLLSIGIVSLFFGMTAVCAVTQSSDSVRDRYVGAWRLAWLEQQDADGKVHRIDCCGMFVFTRDGHAAVQVMQRASQGHAATDQYSRGGYEATYGNYVIDESTHTFTFHVEGSLMQPLIGKDLPRSYEFSGKQLIVKSTRSDEHWRVAWEHY